MTNPKRSRIAWAAILALVLALGCAGLWWRMGGIEVLIDAQAPYAAPVHGDGIEFSIVTYNVQARPWFDATEEKFTRMSPLLNAYDIWAIQECFKDHHRLWAQAEHPVKVYHGTLRHPFKIVGSGLSILGRFPLADVEGHNFTSQGDFQNRPASKGVLLARFLVRDMPVDVYTTHIAAGRKPASLAARFEQGDELIRFVRANSPDHHSVIVLGDFNMRPSRGPEDKAANADNPRVVGFDRIVSALDLRDASDEINGPVGTEIDRILFRPGSGHIMQALSWQHDGPEFYDPDGNPLSDHEPVIVTFRLTSAVTPVPIPEMRDTASMQGTTKP